MAGRRYVSKKCVDVQVQIDGIRIEKPIAPVNNKYSDKETAERVEIVFTYETLNCSVNTGKSIVSGIF